MVEKLEAHIEFLEFIAELSNPATGEIESERLAMWLGTSDSALKEGGRAWTVYASGILAVLDAMQRQTGSLQRALAWFALPTFAPNVDESTESWVRAGHAARVVEIIKHAAVRPYS